MFWKKKKTSTGTIFTASLLRALGLYFGVVAVRLQISSYEWLVWEAIVFYVFAFFMFGLGKQIHSFKK